MTSVGAVGPEVQSGESLSKIGKHRDVDREPGGDRPFARVGIESRRWRRDASDGET